MDFRSIREHLQNRCMLNRKPYRAANGQRRVRKVCGAKCKHGVTGHACTLTRQPTGVLHEQQRAMPKRAKRLKGVHA